MVNRPSDERDRPDSTAPAESALEFLRESEQRHRLMLDHFLATVSHDIRTPLTPIMLWAQILDQEEVPDRALLRDGLDMIRKCTHEQHELIEDLVDTLRIMTGKLRIECRPTDLAALVQTTLDRTRPEAAQKELTLESSLDSQVGTVLADPRRLQQAIANVLNNAVKFTPHGGRISLHLRRDGETVEIQVSDNGIGLTPEFLPRIFNRFGHRENFAPSPGGGKGLGLSIARPLVELHHGTLTAQSEGVNRGATFTVRLPLASIESAFAKGLAPTAGRARTD